MGEKLRSFTTHRCTFDKAGTTIIAEISSYRDLRSISLGQFTILLLQCYRALKKLEQGDKVHIERKSPICSYSRLTVVPRVKYRRYHARTTRAPPAIYLKLFKMVFFLTLLVAMSLAALSPGTQSNVLGCFRLFPSSFFFPSFPFRSDSGIQAVISHSTLVISGRR